MQSYLDNYNMLKEVDEEISLRNVILKINEWASYLLSKWRVILITAILGASLGVGYSFFKKTIYHGELTFAIEEKTAGGSGLGAIASQFGLSMGSGEGGAFIGDNILELMKSRNLIEKTLLTQVKILGKDELIVNRYIQVYKLDKEWEENPNLKGFKFTKSNREEFSIQQDSILNEIYKSISNGMLDVNKFDKKLNIVSVDVKSIDELFSKLFCESLVKNVADYYVETKTSKSRANIAILEFRADSVRRELDQSLYGRAQLSDQNLGLVRQQAAVPKMKQELRVQVLSTMYAELVKNLEFSKMALMREEPLIQIIDKPILPLEKDKLRKSKGAIVGALLFGFFCTVYLIIKKLLKTILSN